MVNYYGIVCIILSVVVLILITYLRKIKTRYREALELLEWDNAISYIKETDEQIESRGAYCAKRDIFIKSQIRQK